MIAKAVQTERAEFLSQYQDRTDSEGRPYSFLHSRAANDLMVDFCKKNDIPCIDLLSQFRKDYSEGAMDFFFKR